MPASALPLPLSWDEPLLAATSSISLAATLAAELWVYPPAMGALAHFIELVCKLLKLIACVARAPKGLANNELLPRHIQTVHAYRGRELRGDTSYQFGCWS